MIALWGLLGLSLMFAVGDAIAGVVDDFESDDEDDQGEGSSQNSDTQDTPKLVGTEMGDLISGSDNSENIQGFDGNDTLLGEGGDDTMFGNAGADVMIGGSGMDRMFGGSDADGLAGGDGNDLMRGGANMDALFGQNGDDTLKGDAGDDVLVGGDGADTLQGGVGNDMLFSGSLQDEYGAEGLRAVLDAAPAATQLDLNGRVKVAELDDGATDTLMGGDGDDDLILGATDIGTGGAGQDYFYVLQPDEEQADARGVAEILDFNPQEGEALILLANSAGDHLVDLVLNDDGSQTVFLNGDAVARLSGDSAAATLANISVVNPSEFLAA